jgi:hypothetical protein
MGDNKCIESFLSGNPQGVYLYGRLGGPVIMSKRPPNHSVHTECIVMRALQSFYIVIYFTPGLSDGNMCPLMGGPSPDAASWAFG